MPPSVNKTLLVVDDEDPICNFVKLYFEERGFKVICGHTKEEAVAQTQAASPDVVLLDINMVAEGDGLLALPKILEISPQIRVVMTTAVDDEISIARARKLGAVGYLTKPLILDELEQTVYQHTGLKSA